jgi:hypothetical protein
VRQFGESDTLPESGGNVKIDGPAIYLFKPDISGFWEFRTSENGASDPALEIYDLQGFYIGGDDDSGGNFNALLSIQLDSETTYIVNAKYYSGSDEYMLSVSYIGAADKEVTDGGEISSTGEEVSIQDATKYTFTPEFDGIWEIRTLNNGNSDPTLALYDPDDNLVSENDDSVMGNNAVIIAYLQAGKTYTIYVGFYNSVYGNCTLRVSQTQYIPEKGGTVHVDKVMGFIFIPYKSGTWEFLTSYNIDSDPYLYICDKEGAAISQDVYATDDSGNVLMSIDLDAETTYIVFAESYNNGDVDYNLSVTIK